MEVCTVLMHAHDKKDDDFLAYSSALTSTKESENTQIQIGPGVWRDIDACKKTKHRVEHA